MVGYEHQARTQYHCLAVKFILKYILVCRELIFYSFGFNEQLHIMGYITRSWPQGLVLFLQPARMNPFGRAEKDHAEEERRDHEYLKKQ